MHWVEEKSDVSRDGIISIDDLFLERLGVKADAAKLVGDCTRLDKILSSLNSLLLNLR